MFVYIFYAYVCVFAYLWPTTKVSDGHRQIYLKFLATQQYAKDILWTMGFYYIFEATNCCWCFLCIYFYLFVFICIFRVAAPGFSIISFVFRLQFMHQWDQDTNQNVNDVKSTPQVCLMQTHTHTRAHTYTRAQNKHAFVEFTVMRWFSKVVNFKQSEISKLLACGFA